MKTKKLNIMKGRPGISDAEINAMMDFDKVLVKHRAVIRNRNLAKITGSIAVVAAISLWFVLQPDQPADTPPGEPVTGHVVAGETNTEKPKEEEPEATTPAVTPGKLKEKEKKEAVPATKPEPEVKTDPETTTPQYTEAEPVNGYPGLYDYFRKELTYPPDAVKDSIEGIVSVSFVINKDGKPEQIKILNSLGPHFDDETIRVINGMPLWNAATLNGKPIPARISMPLTFQIDRKPTQP